MDIIQSIPFKDAARFFVYGAVIAELRNPSQFFGYSSIIPLQCTALSLIHELATTALTEALPTLQQKMDSHFMIKGMVNFTVLSGCMLAMSIPNLMLGIAGIEQITAILALTAIAKTIVFVARKLFSSTRSSGGSTPPVKGPTPAPAKKSSTPPVKGPTPAPAKKSSTPPVKGPTPAPAKKSSTPPVKASTKATWADYTGMSFDELTALKQKFQADLIKLSLLNDVFNEQIKKIETLITSYQQLITKCTELKAKARDEAAQQKLESSIKDYEGKMNTKQSEINELRQKIELNSQNIRDMKTSQTAIDLELTRQTTRSVFI